MIPGGVLWKSRSTSDLVGVAVGTGLSLLYINVCIKGWCVLFVHSITTVPYKKAVRGLVFVELGYAWRVAGSNSMTGSAVLCWPNIENEKVKKTWFHMFLQTNRTALVKPSWRTDYAKMSHKGPQKIRKVVLGKVISNNLRYQALRNHQTKEE